MAKLWKSVNSLYFFAFLMAMMDRLKKPLVVILDNAAIHTAKKLKPYWDLLEEKSYFLSITSIKGFILNCIDSIALIFERRN
jgi:hypothetical protein